ncbi:MAG: type 4a pilus biogenesis protein PilO [Candidatus Aminicenantales bacterium]
MKNWPWYGFVFVGILLAGIVYFVYLKPKAAEVKHFRTERQNVEESLNKLRAKKRQLDKIEVEMAQLNENLSALEEIIPKRKEISEILKNIQQLAFDAQLDIIRFSPQKEVNKDYYSEWPIPIEIRGNYHNLGFFFDRIIHSPRLYNIENFTIKSLSRQTDEKTISANFTAKTYFLSEETVEKPKTPAKKKTTRKQNEMD